jgi:hypothetical protein
MRITKEIYLDNWRPEVGSYKEVIDHVHSRVYLEPDQCLPEETIRGEKQFHSLGLEADN